MVEAELDQALERIVVRTELHHKELISSIPGANWSPKIQRWTIPVSWGACLALRGTFGDLLEIGHALNEWASREYATRVGPSTALRLALTLEEIDDATRETVPALKLVSSW